MTPQEMQNRMVRYGDLIPCRTAFIDAHTPGSDQKENFTIIGAGVSEAVDQHVHIQDTPGFNIGSHKCFDFIIAMPIRKEKFITR